MFSKKIVYIAIIIYLSALSLISENIKWKNLEKGLDWGVFKYKKKNPASINIYVLRIDPDYFSLHLLTAKQKNHNPIPLDKWCRKYRLIAGVNASMYLPDGITSTGYMKNYSYVNNSRINRKFGAFISFNPKKRHKLKTMIIDKANPYWEKEIRKYSTVIQNYRIIDKEQKIVWTKNNNRNSIVSFGIDRSGKILLIMCQDRISTFFFAELILKSSLDIHNMAYLEGGIEASLFIDHKRLKIQISGKLFSSQEGDFFLGQRKLPNIIGIRKK